MAISIKLQNFGVISEIEKPGVSRIKIIVRAVVVVQYWLKMWRTMNEIKIMGIWIV